MCPRGSARWILGSGIAGHGVCMSSALLDAANSSEGVLPINAAYCQILKIVILIGIEWHLFVVFLYILLMAELNSFLHVMWPFGFLLHCWVIFFFLIYRVFQKCVLGSNYLSVL